MEGRSSLIAAIVSGALAVAIVTVDLQFGLEAELQTMEDGEWVTVDRGDGYYYAERPFGAECANQELRVYVHNDRPFSSTVDVAISYFDRTEGTVSVLKETWELGPGDVQFHAFTIPDEAFVIDDNNTSDGLHRATVQVEAIVDDMYLGSCVAQEGSA